MKWNWRTKNWFYFNNILLLSERKVLFSWKLSTWWLLYRFRETTLFTSSKSRSFRLAPLYSTFPVFTFYTQSKTYFVDVKELRLNAIYNVNNNASRFSHLKTINNMRGYRGYFQSFRKSCYILEHQLVLLYI